MLSVRHVLPSQVQQASYVKARVLHHYQKVDTYHHCLYHCHDEHQHIYHYYRDDARTIRLDRGPTPCSDDKNSASTAFNT